MEKSLIKKLNEVITILSNTGNLSFIDGLLTISDIGIITPVGNILPSLENHKSNLKDQFINLDLLNKLIGYLTAKKSLIRLNHIGFCYKVSSQENEKKRLSNLIQKSQYHLYQEQSNDDGLWLFVGNTEVWEKPMIELLPVEKTNDQWVDYWLPHIQIDIDTALTGEEIEGIVRSVVGKTITPFSITLDGIVYIVRNRLGIVDGINLSLDLATNSRKVQYSRQNLLSKII